MQCVELRQSHWNIKSGSRSLDHSAYMKSMPRTIAVQGLKLAIITTTENTFYAVCRIMTKSLVDEVHTRRAYIENVNIIDERRSKIVRNRVFDCLLSPDWRQMAIENAISSDF